MAQEPGQLSENWREEWFKAGSEREGWREVMREIGHFAWQFRMFLAASLIVSAAAALIARIG